MSDTNQIVVKGRKIDQDKLVDFLEEIDITNIDQFETAEGFWKSPITGDLFRTKWQLWGQLGAYLRKVDRKDPREPTRAGYVRAIRQGLEPTPAQRAAHRDYARAHRKKRRMKILAEKGIDISQWEDESDEEPEETEQQTSVPQMSWD